ncbi:hypothetical protein M430DRAFT_70683, partial [Amorphotheca resinae ATCC 22711]
ITHLSDQQYREPADLYFEAVVEYSEDARKEGRYIEVEYSGHVISIIAPGIGSFVLTSDLHSRQILFNSPISGSKAFDWVAQGE